ncbi:MAG: helicase, partial [bacterium]|nr:helicase [bacterium]
MAETAGLSEESAEEQRAAKKGWFPSSMGLSFLTSGEARHLSVVARWGDYTPGETEGRDGQTLPTWQRTPREETVDLPLTGAAEPVVRDVPGSDGLQLLAVERKVAAEDLKELIPPGTRSVSIFLVNRREPLDDQPDRNFAFQSELEVHASSPFVPRPDPRGVLAADWD